MQEEAEARSARTLNYYTAVLKRRWWLIVLVTLITLGAATAYTLSQSKVYRSEMKIVVGQGRGIFPPEVGNVAEQFTQTMSDLLESEIVAASVIDELNLDVSPAQLLSSMDVATKPSTLVLQVTYDDTEPERAELILTAVGDAFTELVEAKLAVDPGADASRAVTATVFDPAHQVPGSVEPRPVRNLGAAAALGLLVGLLLAFAREQLDDTIRSIEQAEEAFGQTATATLPPGFIGYKPFEQLRKKKRRKRRRQAASMDRVLVDIAIQKLGASVLWSWGTTEARSFLVTSAYPEEGKTTIAVNLAVSIAREGHHVILVEADLRRAALHDFLGVGLPPQSVGLDTLSASSLNSALVEIDLKNLSGSAGESVPGRLQAFLTAPGQSWPTDFGLHRVAKMIERLLTLADYVIFDAPPILVVSDAYPLVAAADSVIAVVRNGKSTAAATSALSRTLGRLRVRNARRGELIVTEAEPAFGAGHYRYEPPEALEGSSPSVTIPASGEQDVADA